MEHMERVRAIHRRSAYEHIGDKLFSLEKLDADPDAVVDQWRHPELVHVREMYQIIRNELIEYGQLSEESA